MITEKNANSTLSINTPNIKNVKPVQTVNIFPDKGKELPLKENNSRASTENIKSAIGSEVGSEIEKAVEKINKYIQSTTSELQFSIDKESDIAVIKIIDSKTKELIRQIPGEAALNVARKLNEGGNLEIFKSYA